MDELGPGISASHREHPGLGAEILGAPKTWSLHRGSTRGSGGRRREKQREEQGKGGDRGREAEETEWDSPSPERESVPCPTQEEVPKWA